MAGTDVLHFSVRILPPVMNRTLIVREDFAHVVSVNTDM